MGGVSIGIFQLDSSITCMTYGRLLMTELRAPLAPPLGPLPTGRTAAPTTRLRSGRHPVTWPLAAPTRDTLRHGTSGGQWLGPRPHHAGNTRAAHTPNRWLKFLHELCRPAGFVPALRTRRPSHHLRRCRPGQQRGPRPRRSPPQSFAAAAASPNTLRCSAADSATRVRWSSS